MSYTSSHSSSTASGTSSSSTVATTSDHVASSDSTTVTTATRVSSPDDSDGLAASMSGDAVAIGEDTLTYGELSGQAADGVGGTQANLSASMIAASEDPDGGAYASAATSVDVGGGVDIVAGYTIGSTSTRQDSSGSTATATSTTNVTAYDVDLPDGDEAETAGPASGGASVPTSLPADDIDLDGNVATLEFSVTAEGDGTSVLVDAYALAIDDELSISGGLVEIAVD